MARVRPWTTVRYAKRGAVATVLLDRPEVLNAYDMRMRDELFEILGAAHADPEVRVLVLRGRGRAFSTGGDVREFGSAPSPVVARAVRWHRDVWGRLLALDAVTIAGVHGWAAGGGFEMALLCDLVVASSDARFALPEVGLGMIPGVGGTQTLPRRVGLGRALDVTLAGRVLGARAAAAAGIVHTVVPRARLGAAVSRLATAAARLDPAYARAVRRAVRAAGDHPLALGCALERALADGLEPRR